MGIETCDTMLMILAASRDMPERERFICTQEMIRGFNGIILIILIIFLLFFDLI